MRSMVSSSALRATQQKVLCARQSASTTLQSSPVMRVIKETAVGRSFTSVGTAKAESTSTDIASSRPARS